MNFFELQKEREIKVTHFQFMSIILMYGLQENIINRMADECQQMGNYKNYFLKNVLDQRQEFWFKIFINEHDLTDSEIDEVFSATNTRVNSPMYTSENVFYFLSEIFLLFLITGTMFNEQFENLKIYSKTHGIDEQKFNFIFQEFQTFYNQNLATIKRDIRNIDFKKIQSQTFFSITKKFGSL